jgi:hypothetical protein
MNFSEQAPSNEWAALKYRGETIAEVWFKPEGEAFALAFRIPAHSFQVPGMDQRLTVENLLKGVAIAKEEVETWRHGTASHFGMNGSNPELSHPLAPPRQDATHLNINVNIKPPPQAVASKEGDESEILLAKWQEVEARWRAIEGLEAAVETLRRRTEGLRSEMEASLKTTLTVDEKMNARNGDVTQWTKAKSRIHHTLPKGKEFIHRANWALGAPERKKLGELFKNRTQPPISLAHVEEVGQQLEYLRKARQVLSAHGVTVIQECQNILAQVQGALKTLQSNAAANARKKMTSTRTKNKFQL